MDAKGALLVLAIVCVQAMFVHAVPEWVPEEVFEMVADDKQRCMSEHGTTQAQIDDVGVGKMENNPSITCYMYCLLEAFSLVDEEANLETDMLLGIIPEHLHETASKVLGACTPTTGTDNCNKIFNLGKCVYAQVPDLWFIV
ncbi:general odorant-binding protein 69a-like [Hylaeus anthracinus]|uniref:general odorant-binding protein 69a-like n=1 Tax=Hylaeus anthracinus TaxID=313031 RepID=UPI0023B904BC|nr:general odorant-binding protein 69a-like [Hylaeus anthracinus]